MCKAIGEESFIYKDKNFWKKLLNYKINKTINNYTNKALDEEMKSAEKQSNNNIQKITDNVKYIIDIGTGARNISKLREKKRKRNQKQRIIKNNKRF